MSNVVNVVFSIIFLSIIVATFIMFFMSSNCPQPTCPSAPPCAPCPSDPSRPSGPCPSCPTCPSGPKGTCPSCPACPTCPKGKTCPPVPTCPSGKLCPPLPTCPSCPMTPSKCALFPQWHIEMLDESNTWISLCSNVAQVAGYWSLEYTNSCSPIVVQLQKVDGGFKILSNSPNSANVFGNGVYAYDQKSQTLTATYGSAKPAPIGYYEVGGKKYFGLDPPTQKTTPRPIRFTQVV